MPYSKSNPPTFAKNMPTGAQKIAIDTANAILDEGGKEEDAIRAAIANVKKEYKKSGDKWVPKAALAEIELIITKANVGADGTPRWAATTSDTGPDKAGESASMALFQNWIERVEKNTTIDFLPEPRTPFLGVSHYPSMDGYGEAGPTEKMYIDGNRFKAAGSFYNDEEHPIGKALFEAVCAEQSLIKRGEQIDEPMRISAAWWDLQHSHGDFVFTRKNLTDKCPLCQKGEPRHFLDGQLDHWAVTRVPMNPRTDLELEEKSMANKRTRKEDAESIVGPQMAENLEAHSDAVVGKSDTEEATEAMVIKAEDEALEPDVEKTDEGMMERPFGGAMDLERARAWISEVDKLNTTMDYWQMFDVVMMNILESDEEDKMGMMKKAISDFGEMVDTVKAGLSDPVMRSLISNPEQTLTGGNEMSEEKATQETPAEATQDVPEGDVFDALRREVQGAMTAGDREKAADAIQKSFSAFAGVVRGELDTKYPPNVEQMVQETVAKSMAPFAEKLDLVLAKMNQAPAPAQPVQKSISMNPAENLGEYKVEKSSIRDLARRSVGLPQ